MAGALAKAGDGDDQLSLSWLLESGDDDLVQRAGAGRV
jgi:hypothetical protein